MVLTMEHGALLTGLSAAHDAMTGIDRSPALNGSN
jgi:4-hydroxy-2-oxoheptanedioate aldolase